MFKSINPFDQSVMGEYACLTNAELQQKLLRSESAYRHWRKTSFEHRATLMHRVADILKRDNEVFA